MASVGTWKVYKKNGQLDLRYFFPPSDSNYIECVKYKKNGKISYIRKYREFENKGFLTFKHFFIIRYFKNNDQIEYKGEQIGLRMVGEYLEYYKNGNLKIKAFYNKKSKLNGEYIEWNEDGSLKKDVTYIDGKKQRTNK